jgi:chromosome condensin MukBEF MukE localization factor
MHSSQINNKSFLSSFTRDLETFENAYSVLLDKAKERYVEYDKGGHDPNSHWDIQRKYLGSELTCQEIYLLYIGTLLV